jgi:two-component system LytT family sensor kinase
MKIKFNKYVEILLLWTALGGVLIRWWVIPEITWMTQIGLFFLSYLVLHAIWIFHYLFNDYLNRSLPFEKNIKFRVVVQVIGGWTIVKTIASIIVYSIASDFFSIDFSEISPINRITVLNIMITVFIF